MKIKLKVLIEGKFGNLEMQFGKSGDASWSLQPPCSKQNATALVNQLEIDLKYATNCTNVPTFELVLSHIRVILNHSETKEVFKIIKVNRMPVCTANALFWWLITSKQIEVRTKKMAPSLLCCCYDML